MQAVHQAADGTPKVTDFGLAKRIDDEARDVSKSGAIMGTASYMAPEQAAGKVRDTGPAADVYALGSLLYECLTGRPPFEGPRHAVLVSVLSDEPAPPSRLAPKVPRDLETICLKCLEKQPGRRYARRADRPEPDNIQVFIRGGEADEQRTTAQVVGVDRTNNLAALRVVPVPGLPKALKLKNRMTFAETEKVYVFGSPLGDGVGKKMAVREVRVAALRSNTTGGADSIQLSGPIDVQPGGPLVDSSGFVIGVSGQSPRWPNFAIPAWQVTAFNLNGGKGR